MTSVENQNDSNPSQDQIRCGCGQLLAKLIHGGIEIKCRRCKQVAQFGWPESAQDAYLKPLKK